MAATTENFYTGDGSTTLYSFTFPYISEKDVRVELDDVLQARSTYSFANATQLTFDTAPGGGVAIRIFRDTNNETITNTFYPGATIRARDLNDNFTQSLYISQEAVTTVSDSKGDAEAAAAAAIAAQAAAESLANEALMKSGGTMTGAIVFANGQTFPGAGGGGDSGVSSIIAGTGISVDQSTGNVTVTATGGGGGGDGGSEVSIGLTPPTDKAIGDLWWADNDTLEGGGRLYIYTGTEWVDTSLPGPVSPGPRGLKGDTGEKGDTGADGASPNDGTLTIRDSGGTTLGTFTANQLANTEITVPAAGSSGSEFAVGTKMIFAQANPPSGWLIDSTYENYAFRTRSANWVPSGGTLSFSEMFRGDRTVYVDKTTQNASAPAGGTTTSNGGNITVNGTSLTLAQMASHSHSNDKGKSAAIAGFAGGPDWNLQAKVTGSSGGNESHDHSGTFAAHSHTLSATSNTHAHDMEFNAPFDTDLKFVNTCIGTKL